MLGRLAATALAPIKALLRVVGRLSQPRQPAEEGSSPAARRIGSARTVLAPLWRKSLRWSLVVFGFGLFALAQFGLAQLINDILGWWWVIVAVGIVVVSALFPAVRPTKAFLVWLIASPIVFYFFRGDFGKGLPPVTFDRIALPFMVLFLVIRTLANRSPIRKLAFPEWLMIGFIVFSVSNLVFIQHETDTGVYGKCLDWVVFSGVVYFVAKASLRNKQHLMAALKCLVIVGFISAIAVVIEANTGRAWYSVLIGREIPLLWRDIGEGRGQGLWHIPHITQIFCAMTAFLAFHFAGWTESARAKVFYYVAMVVMILAVYYAYSRTGYIALVLPLLVMPFLVRGSRPRYLALTAGALVLLMLSTPLLLRNKDFSRRMTKDTYSLRVKINNSNINVIKHHPWFGVGFGKVPEAFFRYATSLEHRMHYRTSRLGLARPNNPHNWHLQVLGEEGLAGGALYYAAILGFILYMFRLRGRLPADGALGSNLVTTIIVATVANLIVLNFYGGPKMPYPVWMFWLPFGLMVRLSELTAQEQEQEQEQPDAASPVLQHRAEPLTV